MSMHQIEDMIENSVRMLSNCTGSEINGLSLRDICYHLYQLQDLFDCGYTMLRVREELERMGFLASITVEKLPQNERDAARRLTGGSGFLPSGVYVDGDSGLAYLDYGNPSWNTFIEAGTLSHPQMGDIPQIDVLQLAENMISLAAQQRETGSDNGEIAVSTLLYWYALLPTVMTVSGYEGQVEEERIIRLRDMAAVPEAFEQAGILWLTSELEDLADLADEDLDCFANWAEPYLQWKKEAEDTPEYPGSEFSEQEQMELFIASLNHEDYSQADFIARRLDEPSRSFGRINAAMSFYTAQIDQPEQTDTPQPHNIMTLTEVEEKLIELTESEFPVAVKNQLYLHLAQCRFLLKKLPSAIDSLNHAFALAADKLLQMEDAEMQRVQMAYLTASYYMVLICNLNKAVWDKVSLPTWLLPLKEALQVVQSTVDETAISAEQCCNMALLLLVENKLEAAMDWLDRAEQKNPDRQERQIINTMRRKLTEMDKA
ncbi:MAG: hypothetical protein LUH49_12550 [Cloacibacillus porcorum]|uniref:hypothetical protein n=1 Tax=Cloacibacillus porcorum TaxID=1197717 RepID=UPI0023F3B1D3|nr:hypothetical protein [Cloacibacillus porcorum]MCD7877764.1 hypothetical protein [Cloacibacillus porcorum]